MMGNRPPYADYAVDGYGWLHGGFLTTDENGQGLFAATASGLAIVQLANVPLGIGALSPASGVAAGRVSVTLRGSGFQSGTKVTLGGKTVAVSVKDQNLPLFMTPGLSVGAQQLVVTNLNSESVALDAAFLIQ